MGKSKPPSPVSGVYAALVTPRQPNSVEADCGALFDYQDVVVRAGVDGLVLFGSTGEFVHFDLAERKRVLTLVTRRSRAPVLVNVSHSTLAGAVDLAENAIAGGAAGLLLMPPYFYRYTDDQVFAFYEQFVKLTGKSAAVYLYNLPFFTHPISASLAERLLGSGVFAGIKDSSGEWGMFEALRGIRDAVPFKLLIGHESIYLRGRLAGADGIISGVAAAVPELLVAIDRAIRASDLARGEQLNIRLREFVKQIENFPATVGIKQAAGARGWKVNHFALPFDRDTATELSVFQEWFRGWLPAVLSECRDSVTLKA
ncbi:MAG: dihydrodipicolinate synthase family protein [Acidobacteriaceae bacterium]|nr:dihydrodipicolinate synthase family protein [Acidobacteriaceae bacterium]